MSELTFTVLRLGMLVLLWVLVLSVVGVLRRDVFGTRVVARPTGDDAPRRPRAGRRERETAPAAAEDRDAPRRVAVVEGPLRGTTLALGSGTVLLGRSPDCSLVVEDQYASGRHARLFPQEGRWYVEDLGSTNGTLLDGQPLGQAAPVRAGSRLRIGGTLLELQR